MPRLAEVGLDPVVLAFTVLLSLACGMCFGAFPALIGSRAAVRQALHEGVSSSGSGRLGRRLQPLLAVSQLALALVLTVGAGLLLHSFVRLTWSDPGFEAQNLLAARIAPAFPQSPLSPDEEQTAIVKRLQFFEDVRSRAEVLPGVREAALGYSLPFAGHSFSRPLTPLESPAEVRDLTVDGNAVSGSYFRVMGMRLLRGRTFDDRDRLEGAPSVILNLAAAELFWPGLDPIGKQVAVGSRARTATVVGVVSDIMSRSLGEAPQPFYYRSLQQSAWVEGLFVLCRLSPSVSPEAVATSVRRSVWDLDSTLPVTEVASARQLIERSVEAPRLRMLVLGGFGAVAVLLALVGIYGVVSQTVGRRRREIGIRMALGAGRSRIIRMVLIRGLLLAVLGLSAGLLGALALSRFLEGLLYGLTPRDPFTYAAAFLALAAAALLAVYLPARRASRIDPLDSLRCE